nr:hypothetical protein [Tanacetum cinerariifolium]
MDHPDDLTDFVPPTPHDSPLSGEEAQTTQAKVITRLKLRVRRLEKKRKARTSQPIKRRLFKGRVETSTNKSLGEDASKQGRNDDKIEELNLTNGADTEVIVEDKGSREKGGSTARPEVSSPSVPVNVSAATPSTPPTTTTIFGDEDLSIAQTLIKLRNKGKGVLVEEELEKLEKVKRRYQGLAQIEIDADLAQRIYEEEFAELDRVQKEKQKQEEATIAVLTQEFDEIQARIDVDHELAIRMTHKEREKYAIKERARLLAEYFERRKKQLAAERAEAIKNKPPTRTQVENMMITYLKDMGKYTHQKLKHKTLEELQKLYQKEQKWINDFVPMDSEKEEKKSVEHESKGKKESAKSDEEELADYEHEKEELRMWLTVVSDKEKTVDLEILSTKYPIVDWESQNLGNVDMEDLHVYKIIRANRNISYHKSLSSMLRKFYRQDLVDLHRLVMKRFEDSTLEGDVGKTLDSCKYSESVPLMLKDHVFLQVFLPLVHSPPPGSSSRSYTAEYIPLHASPLFGEQW